MPDPQHIRRLLVLALSPVALALEAATPAWAGERFIVSFAPHATGRDRAEARQDAGTTVVRALRRVGRIFVRGLLGALLSAATLAAPAVASELPVAPPQRAENPGVGEIIVAFRADVSREDRASLRAAAVVSRVRSLRLRDTELVKAPEGRSAAALRALSRSPRVRYAEPNGVVRAQSADTYWTLLWGLKNTGQKVNGVTGTADPGESGAGRESNGIDDDRNGLVDDYRG